MEKVLIAGDVEGRVDVLYKRIKRILKKENFSTLFCVGSFFSSDSNSKRVWEKFKTSGKASLTTYVLGPNNSKESEYFQSPELAPDIEYLGKTGIYTTSTGVKIVYISGMELADSSECRFDVSDIEKLCLWSNCQSVSFHGVDILLVSPWPAGISPVVVPKKASKLLGYLINVLKPRYVFAGIEGIHYEREPFVNVFDYGQDPTLCRFISLAKVGTDGKWLYGLQIRPNQADVVNPSLDVAPFRNADLPSKRKGPPINEFLFSVESSKKPKTSSGKDSSLSPKDCWFCLAGAKIEKHLVISVGKESYMTLPKGGLVDYHLLICSIEHYKSTVIMPLIIVNEIDKYRLAVTKFYKMRNRFPVFFERNFKTFHSQMNAVPIPSYCVGKVTDTFKEYCSKYGLEITEGFPKTDHQYLYVESHEELPFHIIISKSIPVNFAREVLSDKRLLNVPNRISWEECKGSEGQEKSLASRIRSEFQPFDFSLP